MASSGPTMSYLSGTSSPVPGTGNRAGLDYASLAGRQPPLSAGVTTSIPAGSYASPALAYANAQLSNYAAQAGTGPGQMTALPSHLNPYALTQALAEYSASAPGSAQSSPGTTHKRLHGHGGSATARGTGYNTPGGINPGTFTPSGNGRVAASVITGKRLNWSEMICQTIAESDQGRLVIQDLFEGMCAKFPEIREWAFGKDWEARVKNRIKSTLSIKGNLFIKVPRPSSAAGKGSWWTLSQEAHDAWKDGRITSVVKASGNHSRSSSAGKVYDGVMPLSTATSRSASRANSRAPSRRSSPVSSRGPSSHHAHNAGQHQQGGLHSGHPSPGAPHQRTSASPSLGMGFGEMQGFTPMPAPSSNALGMTPMPDMGFPHGLQGLGDIPGFDPSAAQPDAATAHRMRMMENSVNDAFGHPGSSNGGMQMPMGSIPMPMSAPPGQTGLFDFSYTGLAGPQPLGNPQTAPHLGGPQSMPFPASMSQAPAGIQAPMPVNDGSANAQALSAENAALIESLGGMGFGNFDMDSLGEAGGGMPNPFGNSLPGGYTMLSNGHQGGPSQQQQAGGPHQGGAHHGTGGSNPGSGSGGRGTPSAASFSFSGANGFDNGMSLLSGPSPADSTSPWLAFTPSVGPADRGQSGQGSGDNSGNASARHSGSGFAGFGTPTGGENSKPSDLQLPPPGPTEQQSSHQQQLQSNTQNQGQQAR